MVGVIDGGSTSCNESVRNYENHSSGGKALAQREFYTVDGQKFSVTAYSEWIEGRQAQFILLYVGKYCDKCFLKWHCIQMTVYFYFSSG